MKLIKKTICLLTLALAVMGGTKNVMAQDPVNYDDFINSPELEDLWNLLTKTYNYVISDPGYRAYALTEESTWDELPDISLLLRDLQALFNKKIDSAAYSYDTPEFINKPAVIDQFYEYVEESGVDYRDNERTVTLPDEVKEMMTEALNDSSACEECTSSTSTTGSDGHTVKLICKPTLNSLLLILNAYFSCTPQQRVLFYNTYCYYPCNYVDPCSASGTGTDATHTSTCSPEAYKFTSMYGENSTLTFNLPISKMILRDIQLIDTEGRNLVDQCLGPR